MFAAQIVQGVTVGIAALIAIMGAFGVVGLRNPVHNALSLVATLFGVAVLYVAQGAYFLAAIQALKPTALMGVSATPNTPNTPRSLAKITTLLP